jgi:hypothetical protein
MFTGFYHANILRQPARRPSIVADVADYLNNDSDHQPERNDPDDDKTGEKLIVIHGVMIAR